MEAAAVGADAGRRPEPLQMLERRRHGDVVGLEEPVVAGQRPPHRQRLRRRERGVEPRHRPHHPTIGREPVEQLATQRCPRHWVTARQQRLQRLDVDRARQPEPGRLATRPHARHLARRGRQVLRVVRRRRRRRRRVQGRHPQHRPGHHPRPLAGTCLNLTSTCCCRTWLLEHGELLRGEQHELLDLKRAASSSRGRSLGCGSDRMRAAARRFPSCPQSRTCRHRSARHQRAVASR